MRSTTRKLTAAAAIVLVSAGAIVGPKAYEMAADPLGERAGPPLGATTAAAPGGASATSAAGTIAPAGPAATLTGEAAALPWSQRGGTVNDASCLNRTAVYGVIQVTSVDQIRSALQFARENNLKVSLAGARHSMGGHAFARNALVLDMTHFNAMSLDAGAHVLTVQSGATWHQIQETLHPLYAVKAMQSTDIFTVG